MTMTIRLTAVTLAFLVSTVAAHSADWKIYRIAETGTSVDVPVSIFPETAGKPDGHGQRFVSEDGRADFTVQSVANQAGDSPAQFLAKKNPPSNIVYQRITDRFFVVSSFKGDRIWYNRCNFANRFVHCVLINYPAEEKRQWDRVVTRISHSLNGG